MYEAVQTTQDFAIDQVTYSSSNERRNEVQFNLIKDWNYFSVCGTPHYLSGALRFMLQA